MDLFDEIASEASLDLPDDYFTSTPEQNSNPDVLDDIIQEAAAEQQEPQSIYGDGGILTALASIPAGAASQLTKQVGGGMQFLGDLFGGDVQEEGDGYFQRLANETSNLGNYIQDAGAGSYEDIRNTMSPDGIGGGVYDIGSGISSSLVSLLAGGPVKSAITEGIKQGAGFYGDLIDQGADSQNAAEAALKDAGINSLLNVGPLKMMYNPARSAVTRYGIAPLLDAGLSTAGTDIHLDLQEVATGQEISPETRSTALKQAFITAGLGGAVTAKIADSITGSTNSKTDLEIDSTINQKSAIADSLLEAESEIQTTPVNGTDVPLPPEVPVNNAPEPVKPTVSQDLGQNVEGQASAWLKRGKKDSIDSDSSIKIRASEKEPAISQPKADEAPIEIQLQRQIAPSQVVKGQDGSVLTTPKEQISLFEKTQRRQELQKQRGSWSNRPIKDTSEGLHTDEGIEAMDVTMRILEKEKQKKGKGYKRYAEGESPEIRDLTKERPEDSYSTPGLGWVQRKLSLPYYKMKDDPIMRPAMEAANNIGVRQVNVGLEDAHATLTPYMELTPQEKRNANTSLITAFYKGNKFSPTPENFKALGNTDREIAGILAYRKYLDVDARSKLKETLLKKNFDPTQVESFINGLDRNYIPAGRYGNHVVRMMDADGNIMGVRYFENRKDADAVALAAKMEGARVEIDKVAEATKDSYSSLPLNLVAKLNEDGFKDLDLDASYATREGQPIRGYSKHLVSSKKIAGFSDDLERNISEYAYGLEKWKANADMKPILDDVSSKLGDRPELKSWFDKWTNDLNRPGGDLATLRKLFTGFYMGGSVRSAVVNMTQTFQNTWPKLVDEVGVGKGSRIFGNAHSDLLKLINGKKLAPELQSVFEAMQKDGTIEAAAIRDFTNRLQGRKGTSTSMDKVVSTSLIFHSLAEKYNRSISAIAGVKAGQLKGLKGEGLLAYARDFVDSTQHVYSKWNKPELGRGKWALPYQFKHYALSQLNFLSQLGGKGWKNKIKSKGLAAYLVAQMGLGGAVGVPFGKLLISIAEKAGYDPIDAAEKYVTEGADYFFSEETSKKVGKSFTKGAVKEVLGADISGSAGLGDVVQLQEGGLTSQIGSIVAGPIGNIYDRFQQAKTSVSKYDNWPKALDKLLPVSLGGVSQAIQASNANAFKSMSNNTLVNNPTETEIALKALGFSPKRLSDAHQTEHSKYIKSENEKNANENINFKIAKAMETGDDGRLGELIDIAAEKGIKINNSSIKKYLKKWEMQKTGLDDLEVSE